MTHRVLLSALSLLLPVAAAQAEALNPGRGPPLLWTKDAAVDGGIITTAEQNDRPASTTNERRRATPLLPPDEESAACATPTPRWETCADVKSAIPFAPSREYPLLVDGTTTLVACDMDAVTAHPTPAPSAAPTPSPTAARFPGSALLGFAAQQLLNTWVAGANGEAPNQAWTRCYGKSVDGGDSATFHARCDGLGPTLTVVKLSTGKLIGGYAGVSWGSSGGYATSPTNFLFSLTSGFRHDVITAGSAQYHSSNYGPTFGSGHDLHIQSDMNGESSTGMGNTYKCRVGWYGTSLCENDFYGVPASGWTIDELEVWHHAGATRSPTFAPSASPSVHSHHPDRPHSHAPHGHRPHTHHPHSPHGHDPVRLVSLGLVCFCCKTHVAIALLSLWRPVFPSALCSTVTTRTATIPYVFYPLSFIVLVFFLPQNTHVAIVSHFCDLCVARSQPARARSARHVIEQIDIAFVMHSNGVDSHGRLFFLPF